MSGCSIEFCKSVNTVCIGGAPKKSNNGREEMIIDQIKTVTAIGIRIKKSQKYENNKMPSAFQCVQQMVGFYLTFKKLIWRGSE